MISKKENKKLLIIFLFILIILSSYQIILSQTNSIPNQGNTATGNQNEVVAEDKTEAGVENPPTQGSVKDNNGEKQDIGGLVGLEKEEDGTSGTGTGSDGLVPVKPIPGTEETETNPSVTDSTPSLKGKNLDFERDLNAKEGEQKVKVTPNEKLGESKLELNGNEFSAKESNGELGKATFSIEKKEGEQFPETGGKGEGTKYTVKGGEGKNGNAKDELAGREIELSKDTTVKITEDKNGKRQVEMTVQKGGEIHQPGERKNGKEEEGKETDYNWKGLNLNWFDSQGNSHTINGELAWNQKAGFYVPEGKTSLIDGVNLFSGDNKGNNFNTQIFSDGNEHPEALGSYASFGKDTLFTGSNDKNSGPALQFLQGNKYGVNIDSKSDLVAMQANAGGQISLTNRASQGLSPNVELMGAGGWINNGAKSYISDGNRFDYTRNLAGLSRYTSTPLEINPTGINGKSLIGDNRYLTNNFNQGAVVPNNYNFDTQGPYSYQENSFDPRIGYNMLNQQEQQWVNSLETPQKQANFMSMNQQEKAIFTQQNLQTQRQLLESNNIHDGIRNLPGNNIIQPQQNPIQQPNSNLPSSPNLNNPSLTNPYSQTPLQPNQQQTQPPSGTSNRRLITKDVEPLRKVNNGPGLSVLDDIENHANQGYDTPAIQIGPDGIPKPFPYNQQDIITKAHETTHKVNERLRGENGGDAVNGFYLLNGKYVLLKDPKLTIGDIHQNGYIPHSLRGDRYSYITNNARSGSSPIGGESWNNKPLYLMDELNAYTNGAIAGIEAIKNGKWGGGNRDGVSGILDFNVYNVGMGMAIKDQDPNYFNNPQFKEFYKKMLESSMKVFNNGKQYPQIQNPNQETILYNLQNGADAEPMRQFLRSNFGSDWTRKVYGF